MRATLNDLMNLELMGSLKLVAGAEGLTNRLGKVGILDFEFTRRGAAQSTDRYWQPDELILTTLLYTDGNDEMLLDAVKKLHKNGVCGLAVKNVFMLEISREVIRYANQNNFPLFVFTDFGLFFEDIIVAAGKLTERFEDYRLGEISLNRLLRSSPEPKEVKRLALDINSSFKNFFSAVYIRPKHSSAAESLNALLVRGLSRQDFEAGDALVKYNQGCFYIHSMDANRQSALEHARARLSLVPGDFHWGAGNEQFFLAHFREALLQAYQAACYCELYGHESRAYEQIGVYKLLLERQEQGRHNDYPQTILSAITEHDRENGSELLETLMEYEFRDGNVRETAAALFTHENTVRYRLKKLAGLFGQEIGNKNFELELLLAVKLRRIQLLLHDGRDIPV